jgi:hypothetical protein
MGLPKFRPSTRPAIRRMITTAWSGAWIKRIVFGKGKYTVSAKDGSKNRKAIDMIRPWAMRSLELSAVKDDLEPPVEAPAEEALALEAALANGLEELPPVPAGRSK